MAARSTAADPAYWCFVLLGAGTLFPWNAVITAADYWEARYPGKHTDRLLTVSYLPANLVVIAAMVHYHAHMRPRLRIMGGLLGFTLAVSAVPLIDLAPGSTATLTATLLLVALCGVCDGLAQGALFGQVALLPPRYTQALVAGTAASGVVVSLLRVATKATLPDTEQGLQRSANLYFCIAAMVCAACTAVYAYVLPRLPSLRQYRHAALEEALQEEAVILSGGAAGGGSGTGAEAAAWKLAAAEGDPAAVALAAGRPVRRRPSLDLELSYEDGMPPYLQGGAGGEGEALRPEEQQSPGRALLQGRHGASSSSGSLAGGGGPLHAARQLAAPAGGGGAGGTPSSWAVLPLVWQLAASTMLIYVVTLSIFPGVLAEDVHSAELGSWYPVWLITAFNIADMAGKAATGADSLRLRRKGAILGAVLARVLFIPAFHLAAVTHSSTALAPLIIGALTCLLGATNGYLTACAMIEGPAGVAASQREQAGNLMVLALILGLCIGAACGFLWLL